jgi:hypothetical protein
MFACLTDVSVFAVGEAGVGAVPRRSRLALCCAVLCRARAASRHTNNTEPTRRHATASSARTRPRPSRAPTPTCC